MGQPETSTPKLKSWDRARIKHYEPWREERRKLLSYLKYHPKEWEDVNRRCSQDVSFFIHYFAWTYDPRNSELGIPTTVPFIPTPKQIEYLDWLDWHFSNAKNGITEKSRGEGMSWIWVLWSLHKLLYRKGFKAGFGTYKEDKLDQLGNMDSLFEKLRFAYYRLEPQIRAKKFNPNVHDNFKRFYNPDMSSAITGEVGQQIGRGGRNSIYFIDEHAHLQHADAVEKSLSENTNCIIYGSTPSGTNNIFYSKVMSFPKKSVFTFHWRDNPMKNEEWYEDRKQRFDSVTIAQEIDIDYTASVEGIIIPAKWVASAIGYPIDQKSTIIECGIDVGGGSEAGESVYAERQGSELTVLDCQKDMEPTDWAIYSAIKARDSKVQVFKFDAQGVGAGMQGAINKMEPKPRFLSVSVLSQQSPTKKKYDDNPSLTAKDRFVNLRAEMWWNLRERFRKTHEVKTGKKEHPEDELISIPNDRELITQLSQPTIGYSATGKIKIESKEDMRERGIKSPDRADAVVYCFADLQPKITTLPMGSKQS